MDIKIVALPAMLALLAKGGIFLYARFSRTHNLRTQIYLWFLFALAIQNIAEIAAFYYDGPKQPLPIQLSEGYIYFSASIIAIALLVHLASVLGWDKQARNRMVLIVIYAPAALLQGLLWFSPSFVTGFEPMAYTYTKVPGELYFLFEIYTVAYLSTAVVLLIHGSLKQQTTSKRLRNKLMLVGMLPIFLVVVAVVSLQHLGLQYFNTTVTLPIAVTFFLIVTAYATHQHRLFDIEFYIPWSKVRRRKTAFYHRIRAMIAEIADLQSVNHAIRRLADTLRCPVALLENEGVVVATADAAAAMLQIPEQTLHEFSHIVVANEIADTHPEVHAVMRRHHVAAIVPFYPHSRNAMGWLLLGDSFSDQVYTPLDFRLVEELFQRMADLFLDRLLTMRAQLTDAHDRIQVLERRLTETEQALSPLQRDLESLRYENARLAKEQPADSLTARNATTEPLGTTITVIGRDKALLRHLRASFPQVEHYVGLTSAGFKRKRAPDVLVYRAEVGASAAHRKLERFVNGARGRKAALIYGPGAREFVANHKRSLVGSLIEVLPEEVSEGVLVRKVRAMSSLVRSVRSIHNPDYPLIGRSRPFLELVAEAERIAGFREPVVIKTDDAYQAIALAAHIHAAGRKPGKFLALNGLELEKKFANANESQMATLLAEVHDTTVMIENVCQLFKALQDRLHSVLAHAKGVRIIGGVDGDAEGIAEKVRELPGAIQPFVLEFPPLRERPIDVQPLVHYYTLQFNLQAGVNDHLSQSEVDGLLAEDYPRDLAALKTAVFAALQSKQCSTSELADLDYEVTDRSLDDYVAQFEARLITQTLERCDGNKSKAARLLGLRPNTLHYKLVRHGLLSTKKNESAS
ncbi:MAG: helix-turn-helix domain-containing protein [Acidiferrobacterales bacterium]